MRWLCGLIAWVTAACVETGTVPCNGEVCPDGTMCATVTFADGPESLCVQPGQLISCDGSEDRVACTIGMDAEAVQGTCHDEVCLPDLCGNQLRDSAEVCDDGGTVSGDGCSADCRSAEVCGNGLLDPVVVLAGVSTLGEVCDDNGHLANDGCSSTCGLETPSWSEVSFTPPLARGQHVMAYDPRHDQVILLGGRGQGALGAMSSWDGRGWSPIDVAVLPRGRVGASMVYDHARGTMVLFGGVDPSSAASVLDETWEWDGRAWLERVPVVSPPPRVDHAMVYDARRKRIVLFGGMGSGVAKGDTWEWDGQTWTQVQPAASPPALLRHALAYDPIRGVVVLFGGTNGTAGSADTWLFDGATWTKAAPLTSPTQREGHVMAWDPSSQRVILHGGRSGTGDTWAWDGVQWTLLSVPSPLSRTRAALATNPGTGLILFGGESNGSWFGDTWRWTGTQWTQMPPAAQPVLKGAAAALDLDRRRVVVFGGGESGPSLTAELVNDRWVPFSSTPAPPSRTFAAMAYDQARHTTVLFGGAYATELADGTWTWNGTSWTSLGATGNPSPRQAHELAYDAVAQEVVLFGGKAGAGVLGDTWTWNGATWTRRTPSTSPEARSFHAFAYDPVRKVTVLFGGRSSTGEPLRDLWEWSGEQWTERSSTGGPSARSEAAFAWNPSRQRLVLTGGVTGGEPTLDAWEWNGTAWSLVDAPPPPVRGGAAVVASSDGRGVISIGGTIASGLAAPDAWRLTWRSTEPAETCIGTTDLDHDSLAGCADADCWSICAPRCAPGLACDPQAPRCGDDVCNSAIESCGMCPECGPCPVRCGDFQCDASESTASCPGDCSP